MKPAGMLLDQLIDYAGLFPPAQLTMHDAARNFGAYLAGPDRWMLGRFIIPVARFAEFEEAVQTLPSHTGDGKRWPLSALGGQDLEGDIQLVSNFNREASTWGEEGGPHIDTLELRVSKVQDIERTAALVPQGFKVYLEILINTDPTVLIEAIAQKGLRAKVRTGGIYAELIPEAADVVRFLECCREHRVPFKATGGLHHPIRGVHPLTGNHNGPTAVMHGFLNLFLAAAFCYAGSDSGDLVRLLEDRDPRSLRFEEEGISWGRHRVTTEQLKTVREEFALSFGSCSFEEPTEGLRSLGVL
jgi:hypothetical protein